MSGSADGQRILYVDPNNLEGNELTNIPNNTEDLSIFVELTTTQKPRGIIKDGGYTQTGGLNGRINFIKGSQFGNNECDRSLTTSYTDINTEFNNDVFEGFGMESIDITFDTAYTPLVRIKFIDVRGGMLSKGNDSEYKVFFNLPYPIFNLTVKGYYGQAVSYCLHLVKWNAKFNSQTGNFEIDAEFIGYTFAMLTDLLLGYMRAIPYTEIGQNIFNKVKTDYEKRRNINGITSDIITIDEMIFLIDTLIGQLPRIEQTSPEFQEVKKIDEDNKIIRDIKKIHNQFLIDLGKLNAGPYNNSTNNIVQGNETYSLVLEKSSDLVNTRNQDIKELIGKLKTKRNIILDAYDKIIQTELLDYNEFTNISTNTIKYLSDKTTTNKYLPNERRLQLVVDAINKSNKSTLLNQNGFYLYDYIRFNNAINQYVDETENIKRQKLNEFSSKIREKFKNEYNFDPTIRNIFGILVANAETYLQTINTVSEQAEDLNNSDRFLELTKVITNNSKDGLNVNNNSDLYSFPTYYEDATEKWLGTKVSDAVNEVKFTKDLLNSLIESKRQQQISNQFLNRNDNWFCLSTIDTPILPTTNKLVQNPYSVLIGKNEHPHSMMRLLMYRTFTYLAFSNDPTKLPDEIIKFMGKFEANNMFNAITNKQTRDAIYTDFSNENKIIEHFTQGSDQIKNYNGNYEKEPYMLDSGSDYSYNYITDKGSLYGAAYIPINDGYDGSVFYSNFRLKNKREVEQINGITFISNYVNNDSEIYTGATNGPNAAFERINDGARYIDIISPQFYDSYAFSLPTEFATKTVENYDEEITADSIEQNTISDKNLKIKGLNPKNNKFYVNYYKDNVKPDGSPNKESLKSNSDGVADISQIFFADNKGLQQNGTRLGKVSQNEINGNGENMQYYSDSLYGTNLNEDESIGFTNPEFLLYTGKEIPQKDISLFGSPFYYAQNATYSEPLYAKSYLFLNTLPLRGLLGDSDGSLETLFTELPASESASLTISGLFGKTSSFIKTPSLWIAWVGSVLWRYQEFIENDEDPIVTQATLTGTSRNLLYNVFEYPTVFELFNNTDEPKSILGSFDEANKSSMFFVSSGETNTFSSDSYKKVDRTLLNLPQQVKDKFIEFFFIWSDNSFIQLKNYMQPFTDDIIPSSGNNIAQLDSWQNVFTLYYLNGSTVEKNNRPTSVYNSDFFDLSILNIKNDLIESGDLGNHKIELDYSNSNLTELFTRVINDNALILNHTPNIWRKYSNDNNGIREQFSVKKDTFNNYLKAFSEEYLRLYDELAEKAKDNNKLEQEIFGTTNNEFILLNIYRHLSNIKDKWLGGVDSNSSMFFPCSFADSNNTLFDRFQFLNKAFTDIGNDFILDPKTIKRIIEKHNNVSFFDLISNILANNNFNFIPLPAFVNFNEESAFKKIFEPIPYVDLVTNSKNKTIGPSFICVYIGQTSTNLDIQGSEYPNDGIDLYPTGHCNHRTRIDTEFDNIEQNQENTTLSGTTRNKFANRIPVFEVNYAQQNQSYFKDINLDQREFVETQESLVINDDLSRSGDKNQTAVIGQNLFNVYQTRSYSAEIEAMGMPLIQPMMYFQLNNIPMFRGGYLIIRTEHHIKPNHMTTKFKGVRIRDVKTPLNETVFALKDFDLSEIGDPTSLAYDIEPIINNSGVRNSGSALVSVDNLGIYQYNYQNIVRVSGFANSLFNNNSNTQKNGTFLTYNQLFEEVGKLTGTDPNFVKNIAVHESMVGRNKGNIGQGINDSGFVGLMQFGIDASNQVNSDVSNLIFNKLTDFNNYTFSATLDETNKRLKIPGTQTTDVSVNNPEKNSFFDDFISAVAAVEYAKQNLGRVPQATSSDVLDGYLSHQQGKAGYKEIVARQTNLLSDGSQRANNMRNNPPLLNANVKYEAWRDWLNGWQGRIQAIFDEIVPNGASFLQEATPNADKLRETLKTLGYTEKGNEISSGGDISVEIETYTSAILRTINNLYPNIKIQITAGNDEFHQNKAGSSSHKTGGAIDFVVIRPNGTAITPSGATTNAQKTNFENGKTNPPVKYISSDVTLLTNILKVIQGYVSGAGAKLTYLDEYRYPTGGATGPHFHIKYSNTPLTNSPSVIASNQALNAGQITEYTV